MPPDFRVLSVEAVAMATASTDKTRRARSPARCDDHHDGDEQDQHVVHRPTVASSSGDGGLGTLGRIGGRIGGLAAAELHEASRVGDPRHQ
jgi:hypothetical protein